jgi:hypothetical protein
MIFTSDDQLRRHLRDRGYSSAVIEEVIDDRAEERYERQREDLSIQESQPEDTQ